MRRLPLLDTLGRAAHKVAHRFSLAGAAGLPAQSAALVLAVPASVELAGAATSPLLDAIIGQARDCLGPHALILAVDGSARSARRLSLGETLRDRFLRGIRLYCNPAYLLVDSPLPAQLLEAARSHGVAWCGSPASGDLHAVAFGDREAAGSLLWPALRSLVAQLGDDEATRWRDRVRGPVFLPGTSSPERSPALRGAALRDSRPSPEAPRYLNTAVAELLSAPIERTATAPGVSALAATLAARRTASRVPWIFNSLLSEVEYQVGETLPQGLPPELHLALTGVCNLECRFCGYTHDTARFDRVTPERIESLDFLAQLRVLRLNSGLGEPTAIARLDAIIEQVASRYPHLLLNFFTNGVNLHHSRFIGALVGRVRWISVSLNASSEESWRDVCQGDFFHRVLANLRDLQQAKRSAGNPLPLVYATMVLQGRNLEDLPRMPALCREHGVDRFTAFPFSGFTIRAEGKYGPDQSLEACRDRYEAVYENTLREAERHEVSIELPLLASHKEVAFGLERRGLQDFAQIEANDWPLVRFVNRMALPRPERPACAFLWRQASAVSTRRSQSPDQSHYLNPCLGPLSAVDLSRRTPFRFPRAAEFGELWRNRVFSLLRAGQRQPGISPVCDECRRTDTRDPRHFARLNELVTEFALAHAGSAASDQAGGSSSS